MIFFFLFHRLRFTYDLLLNFINILYFSLNVSFAFLLSSAFKCLICFLLMFNFCHQKKFWFLFIFLLRGILRCYECFQMCGGRIFCQKYVCMFVCVGVEFARVTDLCGAFGCCILNGLTIIRLESSGEERKKNGKFN